MSEYKVIKGKRHYVFEDIDEFKEHYDSKMMTPPNVKKNWREGQEGDWVVSDDDKIIKLLKVSQLNHPNDRKNTNGQKDM